MRLLPLLFASLLAPVASAQTFSDASDLLDGEGPPTGFSGTSSVVDVDGDGRIDLYRGGLLRLQREGVFNAVPVTITSNGHPSSIGGVFGDADGNGLPEAYLVELADSVRVWEYAPAREELRPKVRLPEPPEAFFPQGSLWLDANGDGLLDLFVGNDLDVDLLYLNRGDGSFDDASDQLPQVYRPVYGTAAADYDRDGDPDIYAGICATFAELSINFLFENDGAGDFIDVAPRAGVADSLAGWGVTWLDYDNDGWLDAYVANMPASPLDPRPGLNRLHRNLGDGTFEEVAATAGVAGDEEEDSWDVSAADFDNDGWTDLLVANFPEPPRLYRNEGDGTFTDIWSDAVGEELPHFGHAVGDVNGDGWVDIFIPGGESRLLYNDGGTNGWLKVRLRGTASNPDGIGARVEVEAGGLSMVREVSAGSGMISQNHALRAHFGLGTAAAADVTVRWPSGEVDVLEGLTPNQEVTVVEGLGRNDPPGPFALVAPEDGAGFDEGAPVTLVWEAAPDAEDDVSYRVYLATPDDDLVFETEATTFTVPDSLLAEGGAFSWAVAATDGYSTRTNGGAFSFTVGSVAAEPGPTAEPLTLEVYPSPTPGGVTVAFTSSVAEPLTLEVFDMLGRRVLQRDLEARPAGRHALPLGTGLLPAGLYHVRLAGDRSGAVVRPLVRVD